jgi:hypothetical protein
VADKQQAFVSHSSGGWTSKVRVLVYFVSGEGQPPGAWMVLPLCASIVEGQRSLWSLFMKGASLDLITSHRSYFLIPVLRGWDFNTVNSGGDTHAVRPGQAVFCEFSFGSYSIAVAWCYWSTFQR